MNNIVRQLRALKFKIERFSILYRPILCFQCKKLMFYKDAIQKPHYIAGFVSLCKKCEQEIFRPTFDAVMKSKREKKK